MEGILILLLASITDGFSLNGSSIKLLSLGNTFVMILSCLSVVAVIIILFLFFHLQEFVWYLYICYLVYPRAIRLPY